MSAVIVFIAHPAYFWREHPDELKAEMALENCDTAPKALGIENLEESTEAIGMAVVGRGRK